MEFPRLVQGEADLLIEHKQHGSSSSLFTGYSDAFLGSVLARCW